MFIIVFYLFRESRKKFSVPNKSLRTSKSSNELDTDYPVPKSSRPAPDYYNMCVPDLPANSSSGHQLRSTLSLTSIHHHFETVDGEKQSNASGSRLLSDHDRGQSPVVNFYDSLIPLPDSKDKISEVYDRLSPLPRSQKSDSSSPEPVLSPTGSLLQLGPAYTRKMHLTHHPHKYEYIDVDLEHSGESGSSDGVFSPNNMMEHPLMWMSPGSNNTSQLESNKASSNSKSRVAIKQTKSHPRKKQLPLQTTQEESTGDVQSSLSLQISSEDVLPTPRKSKSRMNNGHIKSSTLVLAHQSSSSDESSFELIPNISDRLRKGVVSPSYTPNEDDGSKTTSAQVDELVPQSPPPIPSRSGSDGDIHVSQKPKSVPRPASSFETPPLPPRPQHHKVPLPPVHIDIDKKPLPPKPKVLCIPDNANKKYVSLTFDNVDLVDFDDNNYSTVNINQPLKVNQPIADHSNEDDRVSYSAVNFPVTDALHSTIRQRMSERAQS